MRFRIWVERWSTQLYRRCFGAGNAERRGKCIWAIQELNANAEKANVALSALANVAKRNAVVSEKLTRLDLRRWLRAFLDASIGLGGRWVDQAASETHLQKRSPWRCALVSLPSSKDSFDNHARSLHRLP